MGTLNSIQVLCKTFPTEIGAAHQRAYPAGASWGTQVETLRGRVQGGGSNNLNLRLWVGVNPNLNLGLGLGFNPNPNPRFQVGLTTT